MAATAVVEPATEDPVVRGGVDTTPTFEDSVIRDLAELEQLRQAWNLAEPEHVSPIEQFAWTQCCATTLGEQDDLAIVLSSQSGTVSGTVPFVLSRDEWPRRLKMLGVAQLHEPMDLVYTDEAALNGLISRLAQLKRPMFLGRLPADSPTIDALRKAFQGRGVTVFRPQAGCPVITLDASWKTPEQKLSSRRRSDLRRALRRAQDLGEVRFEVLTPNLEEVDALFDRAVAVEAKSWKGDAGTALAKDPLREGFYRAYVREACRLGTLRLAFMHIGEQVAGMQIAIQSSGALWLLKVGYDAEFARCSPGMLMIAETIRYSAEQGLRSYEFLGKAEDWTRVWTEHERATVSVCIYPLSWTGAAALAVDGAKALGRKLAKKLQKQKLEAKPSVEQEEAKTEG